MSFTKNHNNPLGVELVAGFILLLGLGGIYTGWHEITAGNLIGIGYFTVGTASYFIASRLLKQQFIGVAASLLYLGLVAIEFIFIRPEFDSQTEFLGILAIYIFLSLYLCYSYNHSKG